jgi:ATP synthase protein I
MNKQTFSEKIENKANRKLKAIAHPDNSIWFGLGMMGLIGWSVVVPTLLGAAVGLWVDHHYPNQHSWTLALMISGLVLGCFNAAIWVSNENNNINEKEQSDE